MMIRRITMLVVAALLVLALSVPAFAAKPVPDNCFADGGTIICTQTVPGKNKNFTEETVTTTQGNLKNFSPEPQGVGVEDECIRPGATENCPPGQFPK